jgi:hypothetical protein
MHKTEMRYDHAHGARVAAYTQFAPESYPDNLSEFELWWDASNRAERGMIYSTPIAVDTIADLAKQGEYQEAKQKPGTIEVMNPVAHTDLGAALNTSDIVRLDVDDQCDSEPTHPIELSGHHGDVDFTFYVAAINRGYLEPPPPSSGSFRDTFADLARAAKGRENMDFEPLTPQIYAEAAKGDQAFEAFGMKFTGEQVTRWGIIVLISVQLYLVIYLRRLSNKLRPDDPSWDASDIGLPIFIFVGCCISASA